MAASKTKTASSGSVSKDKVASTSGTTTPATTFGEKDTSDLVAFVAGGKPDKKLYDIEQARIKGEIDTLQAKLVSKFLWSLQPIFMDRRQSTVRDKITLATKSGPGNDRRNALRTELDGIREQQSTNKNSRGKQMEQIKAIQENIQKKVRLVCLVLL